MLLRGLISASILALGLGAAAIVLAPHLLATFLIVAALCAVGAAWANDVRVEYLERLAVDGEAYRIPAVRRFGERLTRPRERHRLATGLALVVELSEGPFGLVSPQRFAACVSELEALARQFDDREIQVLPTSIATCRRLLGRTTESPLYNEDLPPEDLTAALYRIRSGITPA